MFQKNILFLLMMFCALASLTMIFYRNPSAPTITGMATSSGNVTLTVNSTSAIQFAVNSVNWGTGSVNASDVTHNYTCTLDTEGTTTGCINFTAVTQPLIIENNGNTNLSVSIYSNASATDFIGSGSTFQWKVLQNESGSCTTTPSPATYSPVNVSVSNATIICSNLGYTDSNDSLKLNLKVTIPLAVMSGPAGDRSATITVVGN